MNIPYRLDVLPVTHRAVAVKIVEAQCINNAIPKNIPNTGTCISINNHSYNVLSNKHT